MKEAAGEANLTVIAIVLIAIVAAVATPLISNLMHTAAEKSCCLEVGGSWKSNDCQITQDAQEEYIRCVGAKK